MSDRIPRIEYEDFMPELAEALRPKVERLGYCGEIWRIGANAPKSMLSFCNFTEDLKAELPEKLVELVALTVAGVMGNVYERNQHERLSEKRGFGREWIRDVNALRPGEASALDADERKVQRFAIAAIDKRGHGVEKEFEEVVKAVGPQHAVAVLLAVGRNLTHAIFRNTLGLEPPVASIFEEEKAA
ncbi:MAG: carboxymuconolactone decarboxylase family protein [Alphaproteobacteria bacterium]